MKSVIILLIVFSIPFVYGQEIVQEDWKVMKKVNGEWVEVENAVIETHYTVFLYEGNDGFVKYDKSFTNTDSLDGEFGLQQKLTIDPSYQFESNDEETEFGTIALMILAVAIISIIAISAKSRLDIAPRY